MALLIRTFLYEPFNIPSGSMLPTLEIGDYLFVYKPEYGYSKHSFPFSLAPIEGRVWEDAPARGDVIVFKLPTNTSIAYIKRLVGMPGDRIQVQAGRLYINGEMIPREFVAKHMLDDKMRGDVEMTEYIETLPGGIQHRIYEETDDRPLDDTDEYTVPEGHYFFMGDNRDNSQDSRVESMVGFVPFENLVGRADFVFFSTNGYAGLLEFWKWPWTIRYDRFFEGIGPDER
ncbi:MAG TPA: signal peptidase I [Alphaproteobacteria bacterium]|nr:signal peptidase I [Alphaproteobacteria bacterium]